MRECAISALVLAFVLIEHIDGCARSATSDVTTTPRGRTTTRPSRCKDCTGTEIVIATTGTNVKAFASDTTDTSGACTTRTLTCTGAEATITVNGGASTVTSGGSGTSSITVTCNNAGTGWMTADGTTVTMLSCAASLCGNCDPNTIMLTMTEMGTQAFSSDMTSAQAGTGCLQRALTCTGDMATIDVNGGAGGSLLDGGTGSVTATAVCSDNGKDWLIDGNTMPITQLECTAVVIPAVPCQRCGRNAITVTMNQVGAQPFEHMDLDNSGACETFTFVCTGNEAAITFNDGDSGQITDADQGTPGTVTIALTCNDDGMTFSFMGVMISLMECSAFTT